MREYSVILLISATLMLSACNDPVSGPEEHAGTAPKLPDAQQFLVPPMNITNPVGWKSGELPTVPTGFTISAFATNLNGPRNILPLANGDVLAVEAGKRLLVLALDGGLHRRLERSFNAVDDVEERKIQERGLQLYLDFGAAALAVRRGANTLFAA